MGYNSRMHLQIHNQAHDNGLHNALLAIGSNLGDRKGNLDKCLDSLRRHPHISIIGVSTFRDTEPVGLLSQPRFLNGAVHISTSLTPHELLIYCMQLEKDAGRVRTKHQGPRTLDVDIILYDILEVRTEKLQIPHPRFRERGFVLEPASEVAADMIDPVTGKNIQWLLNRLKTRL